MALGKASVFSGEKVLISSPQLLRLSSLDTKVLLLSAVLSGVFAAIRFCSKRPPPSNQFLYDMLGVWTVIELTLIVCADLDQNLIPFQTPDVVELIKSNGPLLPFALLHCIWTIGYSTLAPTIAQFKDIDKDEE